MKPNSSNSSFYSQPQPFLPRYQVLEKLGEGGVATVYKVLDRKEGVEKALKALKTTYSSDTRALERFEEEFRILRSLHHPSLPEMYDYGITEEGTRYMVMEYVQGEALDKYFKKHGDELWVLLHQIVEALEFIHEHNLLHLDFKPGNVLVRRTSAYGGERPLVALIDFGLSYRREAGGKVSVVGTPQYMAPEIISAEQRITRAVDYYSLGITMYELIEGKLPFEGSMEEVLRAHLTKEVSFEQERVEYAELYPNIRGLTNKEAGERLEAFEDFRRSLGAKVGGELPALERAYGMGYVESMGVIGKKELWERLRTWAEGVSRKLKERREERDFLEKGLTPTLKIGEGPLSDTQMTDKLRRPDYPGSALEQELESPDKNLRPSKNKTIPIDMSKYIKKTTSKKSAGETKGEELGASMKARGVKATIASHLTSDDPSYIERKIREDLLQTVREEARTGHGARAKGPVKDFARVVTLSGSGGSGKSFLLDALRSECLIKGMSVFVIDDSGDYEELVSGEGALVDALGGAEVSPAEAASPTPSRRPSKTRKHSSKRKSAKRELSLRGSSYAVDPKSLIIDRFVRGWGRLERAGKDRGAILIADAYEHLSQEKKEFLEYVGKRLELSLDDKKEPGVFVAVSGRRPRLRKELGEGIPGGEKIDELVVPLPGREDVDNILGRFHGHMSGVDDRKKLDGYLSQHTESTGALIGSLKEALVRSELVREGGRWRFVPTSGPSKRPGEAGRDYYRVLFEGLEMEEKKLVEWLSCYRGFLLRDEFLQVSGIDHAELRTSLEKIKPYRLVEVREEKNRERLGIVSEVVRTALYAALPRAERASIHEKYLDFLGKRVTYLEKLTPSKRLPSPKAKRKLSSEGKESLQKLERLYEAVAFHYEQSGQLRESFLMRVKALRLLKQDRDVFGMRRMCEEGIALARRLRGKAWANRKWHLERYFIKEWIEAEWMVDNYRNLVDVVKQHIHRRNRELPISFFYKYGMALARSGEEDPCRKFIKDAKTRIINRNSEPYALTLIVEASLYYSTGAHKASLKILERISGAKILKPTHLMRIYTYLMLNYKYLGNDNEYKKYYRTVVHTADKKQIYDSLLLARLTSVESLLVKSLHARAKIEIITTMKLALRFRAYRILHEAYFIASSVYYEERNYTQALNYLEKASQLAMELGFNHLVTNHKSHFALIYQRIGKYADAISYAELSMNGFSRERRLDGLFYSIIILFDIYASINNSKALIYLRKAKKLSGNIEVAFQLAYYHLLLGCYYYNMKMYKHAYNEYLSARALYSSLKQEDDLVRSYYGLISVCMETGRHNEVPSLLAKAKKMLTKMESIELRAEYYRWNLAYYYMRRKNKRILRHYLSLCEIARQNVRDAKISMHMDALLFRANARLGKVRKALKYFGLYHEKMKEIISNLNEKHLIDEFINNDEFASIVNEFNVLNRK